MSSLKERIQDDLGTAIKTRDDVRMSALRMALTGIRNEEVSGKVARELSDEEITTVLRREVKKRREAAEAFDGAERTDRAERERAESAVLEEYLPAQLSDDELRDLVAEAIKETGAEDPKAMGVLMRTLMPRVGGRADGSRVADEVRRQLSD
jgi:uncharacterized protein